MSISQTQLDIANKSYTNKDFASIYTELLSYAEKLSYRFSPISSNETDPFIIMLKLAAFVADKINYNIDKNILERFMLSCTQETSMRELCDMLGYYMHYYIAASTEVTFKYNKATEYINIPKYSVLGSSTDIQYITVEDAAINPKTKQSSGVQVLQGKLKTLSVLGSASIQLENMDANNRVYFPERPVAENGVFISSDLFPNNWDRVDNLNEHEYLSPIFYFGYDSKQGLPYVQFPEWISRIIGSGLSIKYLITDGYSGNIAPNSFTKLVRSSKVDDLEDASITIINNSSASNGADPETIDAAYTGFKKIVGTVDTLITCRDYAAKIYDLLDKYEYPLVSNIVVSDRRTDVNYATQLYTVADYGKTERISGSEHNGGLTPHDLCLYPYKPIINTDYTSFKAANGYIDAYKTIINADEEDNLEMDQITSMLESSKSISHTYKKLAADDIIAVYIFVKLDAVITTNTKVSVLEAEDIKLKIYNALSAAYNSRTIEPGQEIPFDSIYETILGADARIKTVGLQEPEQTPYIRTLAENNNCLHNPKYLDSISNKCNVCAQSAAAADANNFDNFTFMMLKNVASGRVSLFDYDLRFEYDYMYKNCQVHDNIATLTTEANISIEQDDAIKNKAAYQVKENEAIQLIAPKFDVVTSYPYGVLYYYKGLTSDRIIPKSADYALVGDEEFILIYADSNGKWIADAFRCNPNDLDIISPNFDVHTCEYRKAQNETPDKEFTKKELGIGNDENEKLPFHMLGSSDEIKHKKALKDDLNTRTYCYWLTNSPENQINWEFKAARTITVDVGTPDAPELIELTKSDPHYEYILNEGEYFYYSDLSMNALLEYGSGTRITISADTAISEDNLETEKEKWKHSKAIDANTISTDGIKSLISNFIVKDFNQNYKLTIFMNEIKTLSENDLLEFTFNDNSEIATATELWKVNIPNNSFTNIQELEVQGLSEGALTGNQIHKIEYLYDSAQVENSDSEEASIQILPDRTSLGDEYNWRIRGILDLNMGPDKSQVLADQHKIILHSESGNDIPIYSNAIVLAPDKSNQLEYEESFKYLKSSVEINMNGGKDVALSYLDINTFQYVNPDFMSYSLDLTCSNFLSAFNDEFYDLPINSLLNGSSAGNYAGNYAVLADAAGNRINFNLPDLSDDELIGLTIVVSNDPDKIKKVNTHDCLHFGPEPVTDPMSPIKLVSKWDIWNISNDVSTDNASTNNSGSSYRSVELRPGVNNLLLAQKPREHITGCNGEAGCSCVVADLVITVGNTAIVDESLILKISKPKIISRSALNKALGVNLTADEHLSVPVVGGSVEDSTNPLYRYFCEGHYDEKIPDLVNAFLFSNLDNAKRIEVSEAYPLTSAQAYYDPNHVANAWTLPLIDFENSNITIAKSSYK